MQVWTGTEKDSFRSTLGFIVLPCTLLVMHSVVFFWQLHGPSDSSLRTPLLHVYRNELAGTVAGSKWPTTASWLARQCETGGSGIRTHIHQYW
jgi:hypothetical protein